MKTRIVFALAALTALWSSQSSAVIFGIRYSDVRGQALPGINDNGSKGRFGAFVGTRQKNSVFLVGADYDRYKFSGPDSLLYSRRLTVNIGYRYQLLDPDRAKAMSFMPFLALHYFKSFSKVSADTTVMSAAEARYYQDLSNDSGVWGAIGAEYFFAPVFSFGCEAGLRYSSAKSEALGYTAKLSQFTSYVALLATFYW